MASNTKTHPHGWAWIEQGGLGLAGFDRRSDAAGAQLHFGWLAVLNPRNRLQVRVEAAASVPVREADRIAESWAFAALSAFSHEWMPPTAYDLLRCMFRICNGRAAVTPEWAGDCSTPNHTIARRFWQTMRVESAMQAPTGGVQRSYE